MYICIYIYIYIYTHIYLFIYIYISVYLSIMKSCEQCAIPVFCVNSCTPLTKTDCGDNQ